MAKIKPTLVIEPLVFPRAPASELSKFDGQSKICTMNCGPHSLDPRSEAERKLLCEDCQHQDMYGK